MGAGYINNEGDLIIEVQAATAGSFSEGMAVLSIDGKNGYIDKTGKIVIKPQFVRAEKFSGGLAKVHPRTMDEYGYIDKAGKYVWQPSR